MNSLLVARRVERTPKSQRWPARTTITVLLASIVGVSGCISRPPLNRQTFTFSAQATAATNVFASDRVVAIRKFQIAPPFDGRSLVYRTGEFSYARDPYAEFLDLPDEGLRAEVRGLLRQDGAFGAVLEAGSALKANTLAEISVSELFGDFRGTEHPAAVLTMRFVFLDAPEGVPENPILEREYSRRIALNARTAAALVEGWNKALAEICAEASTDFRHSETTGRGGEVHLNHSARE